MKYRVLRNCYGFEGRYWQRDDIVELDPKSNPPIHFEPMDAPVDVPPAPVVKPTPKPTLFPAKTKAPTVKAHPKPK